jgi:hypothetical protein
MLGDTDALWIAEWSIEEGLTLSINIPKSAGPRARYASWSSFAAGSLGERAVIDGVVADLIMRAHSWSLAIQLEEVEMRCSLFIPAAVAASDN